MVGVYHEIGDFQSFKVTKQKLQVSLIRPNALAFIFFLVKKEREEQTFFLYKFQHINALKVKNIFDEISGVQS